MRILDRYAARQLVPVWLWCLLVFVFLSCLIDLFGHLDEIHRYAIPATTVLRYYAQFAPLVVVWASPLALLVAAAFIGMHLSRHQELLAMQASGISPLRASVPFLFVGWLVSIGMFALNDLVVPHTTAAYERLREEAFRRAPTERTLATVATLDAFNRLYHARTLDLDQGELRDLTVLEHDRANRPTKNLYASRAIWTPHGWLLLYGTIYQVGPRGELRGAPQPFVERLISYPVSLRSFSDPQTRPETLRYGQLRFLILRLQGTGITVRRLRVELASKVTRPLMNLVVCLIAFAGSTRMSLRGNLRGLGVSLAIGLAYYLVVGFWEGLGKKGLLPAALAVWPPHLLAAWWSLRLLRRPS
jgi:lipopolysaccharide export system permease protein